MIFRTNMERNMSVNIHFLDSHLELCVPPKIPGLNHAVPIPSFIHSAAACVILSPQAVFQIPIYW